MKVLSKLEVKERAKQAGKSGGRGRAKNSLEEDVSSMLSTVCPEWQILSLLGQRPFR